MTTRFKWLIGALVVCAGAAAYWKLAIPVHRAPLRSDLIMLGDLDHDGRWTEQDLLACEHILADPFNRAPAEVWRLDLNQNASVDEEDVLFLRMLVAAGGDPYLAAENARGQGVVFPRPREFYRYAASGAYRARPHWAVPLRGSTAPALPWLGELRARRAATSYVSELDTAIHSEGIRFECGWAKRAAGLLPIERDYAAGKLARAQQLAAAGEKFELLLAMIELVEDAETLSVRDQTDFTVKLLTLRDHLRDVLASPLYADFAARRRDWREVLRVVAQHVQTDLGLAYDFEALGAPRNLGSLENYVQRAEWQYYKSSVREADFQALINYAQHDPRYLRAVARTTRKLQDPAVANHNLPMVLLFREAVRIMNGDKRKAAGLLDESIRIPFAWIKSIPRASLPGSLAHENFLLPGNKEDGADKSRHWNVFGALCLYKTPREALDLALRREMQDLREGNYAEPEMREFLRDMIGNLNGMFHVLAMNPNLLRAAASPAPAGPGD